MNSLVGVAAIAVAFPGGAQSAKVTVVGLLTATQLEQAEVNAIWQALGEAGFIEGRNMTIERRSAEGKYDRLPELATDLTHQRPAVIIAIGGTVSALAAKKVTSTIPIVFTTAGDPVKLGLVSTLSRPGGNVTGVTFLGSGLVPKRVEVLRELLPTAKVVGYLVNPANPSATSEIKEFQSAAQRFGLRVYVASAGSDTEIATAFSRFARERIQALILSADAIYTSRRQQVIELAARNAIPTIYPLREFVVAGGLASYGASRTEAYRSIGMYVARILKGERPSDLPVQQSEKVDLAINLRTAKSLGLKIPSGFTARADEVIQ